MIESENQFSLTRVASSTSGRVKKQISYAPIFEPPQANSNPPLTYEGVRIDFGRPAIQCLVSGLVLAGALVHFRDCQKESLKEWLQSQ
jgi:hypothetical protein